jgi:hypothetical protein
VTTGDTEPAPEAPAGLDRQQLIEAGWEQGALLPPAALAYRRDTPVASRPADGEWEAAVIISHPCDVVSDSCDDEPTVEVLPFTRLHRPPARDRTGAQHPRELEIAAGQNGTETLQFVIHDHAKLDRARLLGEEFRPVGRLDRPDVRVLIEWVKRRYDRVVLPEAFARRVKHTKIRDALMERREHFGRLFIQLDPWDEVKDDEPYGVRLMLVLKPAATRDMEKSRPEIRVLLRKIVSALMLADQVLVDGLAGWPNSASKEPSHDQLLAAWDEIVRKPEEVTLVDIAGFRPFHPEAL